jgi:hypothetical protein
MPRRAPRSLEGGKWILGSQDLRPCASSRSRAPAARECAFPRPCRPVLSAYPQCGAGGVALERNSVLVNSVLYKKQVSTPGFRPRPRVSTTPLPIAWPLYCA